MFPAPPVRELDSQFEWAAHEPEALGEGISREIVEIIKHRKDTKGLDEADAIVIELGREVFGARKATSATFALALRPFGPRTLVDLVALMGNYACRAALLTAFDMQLDPGKPPPLPRRAPIRGQLLKHSKRRPRDAVFTC